MLSPHGWRNSPSSKARIYDKVIIAARIIERRLDVFISECIIQKKMIQLQIKNESDLYNSYDPSRTRINDEVYRYLKSFCTDIESGKHLHDTLQIITDSPIDEDRARTAIQEAVKKDQDAFDRQISTNRRRAMWLYLIGILLSAAGVTLSLVLDQVLLALISFFGSMAIRDAVTIHLKLNPDIRHLKKLLDPFRDFRLEVVTAGERGCC